MRNRLGKRECCAALGREARLTGSLRSPERPSISVPRPAGNRGGRLAMHNAVKRLRSHATVVGESIVVNGGNDKDPAQGDDRCGNAEHQPARAQYDDQNRSQGRMLP